MDFLLTNSIEKTLYGLLWSFQEVLRIINKKLKPCQILSKNNNNNNNNNNINSNNDNNNLPIHTVIPTLSSSPLQ